MPELIAAVSDPEWLVCRTAIRSLGEIGDVRAVPCLSKALADAEEFVTTAAARALGELGDVSAVPHLIEALANTTYSSRWVYADALADLLAHAQGVDAQSYKRWASRLARIAYDHDEMVRKDALLLLGRVVLLWETAALAKPAGEPAPAPL